MTVIFGAENKKNIKKGDVVQMNYVLKDESGEVIDQSPAGSPFEYLHGHGNIVLGLEKALTGLKAGDKKKVVVSPLEGYGELDPRLQLTVERKQFPPGAPLEEGMQFETPFENSVLIFTVEAVVGDQITINGNHPLAGVSLHFDVEIVGTREASKDELTHGHVHGPGGHHH